MAIDAHVDEVSRRALGWEETRYTNDGTPYTIQKASDVLLMFRVKALLPELYRDHVRRDERNDISDLLKAVLLELTERHTLQPPAQEAEWAPLLPAERTPTGARAALPAPPAIDDEDLREWPGPARS